MELRQLRYFTTLAEELNFTRAAARLHISQPPLSAQIAQLEDELGVSLFRRDSRRVELTDAGTVFVRDVRRVQELLKEAVARTQNVHAGLAGRIEIGLSGSHFFGPLPATIQALRQACPSIQIALNEMAPNEQLDALLASRIDLSISRQTSNNELLSCTLLWPDPVMAALPATHPLAAATSLALKQLVDEPMVVLKKETSQFAEQLLTACAKAGFTPQIAQQVAEVPSQLSLIAAGLGIGLVPQSGRSVFQSGLVFLPVKGLSIDTGVYALQRKDNLRPVCQTVVEFLTHGLPKLATGPGTP